MVRLRPHHLLCLRHFQGQGYSPDFTRNMARISSALHGDIFQDVLIMQGADDLCAVCPHLSVSGLCEKEEQVSTYDSCTSQQFGVNGGVYEYRQLQKRIDKELTAAMLGRICAGCAWLDICIRQNGEI